MYNRNDSKVSNPITQIATTAAARKIIPKSSLFKILSVDLEKEGHAAAPSAVGVAINRTVPKTSETLRPTLG